MADIDTLYVAYTANPTPKTLAAVERELRPLVYAEAARYQGPDKLLKMRARQLALKAIRTYNPTSGARLSSWVVTQLQGLNRYGRKLRQGVRTPEIAYRQWAEVEAKRAELTDELGAEPSDTQLADAVGIPVKRIQHIQTVVRPTTTEGMQESIDPSLVEDVAVNATGSDPRLGAASSLVYDSLDDTDRQIFDWKTGKKEVAVTNKDIASKLNVSPAYITQRSDAIAKRILDTIDRV